MSVFDARSFAHSILADVRIQLASILPDAPELRARLAAFQADVEVTLSALAVETDPERSNSLREDLERFLPARKAAIVSAARSRLAASFQASLEAALAIAVRAAVIVARAFNKGVL